MTSPPDCLLLVVDGLWRSAQPTTLEQWQHVADLGVQRVIKLNTVAEASDALALDVGLVVLPRPIPPVGAGNLIQQALGVFERPSRQAIEYCLSYMLVPGTLVHCQHGEDRTGLLCGIYRVRYCGWSKDQAWDEMIANGYHPVLAGLDAYWLEDVP